MTHVHIAVFKWKADIDRESLMDALRQIEGLQAEIPGILEISAAENSSRFSEGYSHVVLVRGVNQAAIDAYREHPDHLRAAEIIDAAEDHGIGVDFVSQSDERD